MNIEIYEKIKGILVEKLSVSPDEIKPESELVNDLGINSLELADLVLDCEDAFDIEIDDKSIRAVIDVGGDDRGALAMGRYAPAILSENDYEMLLVINRYRPLTRDCASTIAVMREIETACRMKFTGIVNNSNLGDETTEETVISSAAYADEISAATGLPIRMTTVKEDLYDKLKEKVVNCTAIKLYVKQSWAKQEEDLWQK